MAAWIGAGMTITGLLLTMMILAARIIIKLAQLVEQVDYLVRDKDKVHAELSAQMTNDRSVTDRRLRWLEEHLWNRNP